MEDRDKWLKRQAIQIAAQLPDNSEDALAILEYAVELIQVFLGKDAPTQPAQPVGLSLASSSTSNSASITAIRPPNSMERPLRSP